MRLLQTIILGTLLSIPSVCYSKDLIIFSAEWCPSCVTLKNFIKSNPDQVKDFDIQIIDVDKNPEVQKELKIKLLPTSIIFDDKDKIQSRLEGFQSSNYSNWLLKNK